MGLKKKKEQANCNPLVPIEDIVKRKAAATKVLASTSVKITKRNLKTVCRGKCSLYLWKTPNKNTRQNKHTISNTMQLEGIFISVMKENYKRKAYFNKEESSTFLKTSRTIFRSSGTFIVFIEKSQLQVEDIFGK